MDPTLIRLGMRKDLMSLDFEALVGPYVEEMYRMAAAIVGPDDARDATQDALFAAWRGMGGLRDPSRARPWLHAILVNRCRNLLRTRSRRPWLIHVEHPDDIARRHALADPAGQIADRDRLDRAFETLEPDQRICLALHYTLDLAVPQVALVLGIPEGTAKSRIHAATVRMRAALAEGDDR